MNEVLEPVRAHFETDAAAKQLLAQVRQFSKEPAPPSLRRLQLLSPADKACVVCAPVLSSHVTLGAVLSTARRLLSAPAECTPVLWLRDWSAIALGSYGGQPKSIAAAFAVLVGALEALFPALMSRTRVLVQSDAILRDPSNYWISVIDVGRRFSLAQLTPLEPAPANEQASFVVKVLMHVADMLALCPTHVRCDPSERKLSEFAEAYRAEYAASLPACHVADVEPCLIQLRDPPAVGGVAAEAECEYTVLDSASSDASSKMKKAFCAIGEVDRNPPLRIAQEFMRHGSERAFCVPWRARHPPARSRIPAHVLPAMFVVPRAGTLAVKRKAEDGGDINYTDPGQLEADFLASKLHPGDLKPAVVTLVQVALSAVQAKLKSSPEAKKAEGDLKTALKAMAKAK